MAHIVCVIYKTTLFILQVKCAYIDFLNHCYIDTEVEMKEIYTSSHMWTLFDSFLVDIVSVSASALDRQHADRVSDGMSKVLKLLVIL